MDAIRHPLDSVAHELLGREDERDAAALALLTWDDSTGIAAEVDHHLDRIRDIAIEYVRRRDCTPPS